MKRKEIIGPLLIGVVMMLVVTACASSRRVANESHAEQMDNVRSEQVDSVRLSATTSDSLQKSEQSTMQASSSVWERDSLDELIHELITEMTDAQGNKTTTTDRTIQRKQSKKKQAASTTHASYQRQEVEQMKQSKDSSALSSKTDVGTHWATKDTLSDKEEKNTDDVKKTSFGEKARKNAFQLFLLIVVGLLLLTLKRNRDNKQGKDDRK